MRLWQLLRAEWLKTKHGSLRALAFLVPPGFALFMLWYCRGFTNRPQPLYTIHETFYQVGCIALPLAVALLAGLLSAEEEPAGNFGGYLMNPVSRPGLYLGKLLSLLALVGLCVVEAVVVMIAVLALRGAPPAQLWLFCQGGLLALLGALPLCLLQLYLSLAFGLGASLGAGGAGLLISAIMGTTTIGNTIWPYVPWAWAARLAALPMMKYSGVRLPAQLNIAVLFREQLEKGMVPLVLVSAVGLLVSLGWFSCFSGRKSGD